MSQPIHHTFAPLATRSQTLQSMQLLFQAWKWKHGAATSALKKQLSELFHTEAFLFGSGREALLALLRSLKCQSGEEVIVQGYTCVVVPNAILAAGMTPVFADIDPDTLNLNMEEVERLITPQTRAIICQHTFGIPSNTEKLRELCDRHSLILIEDCAHVIPDASGPRDIGKHGDMLFCSFGRDKAISGVSGGAALCKRADLCVDLATMEAKARSLSLITIKRFLLYPILYTVAKHFYRMGGKALLALAGKLRLLIPITSKWEKQGLMNSKLHAMPNACAILALQQLQSLQAINDHRRMLTKLYFDAGTKHKWPMLLGVTPDLPLQKFPLFVEGAERIRSTLKKQNIHLHDGWTGCVICPPNSDAEAVGYSDGDDPKADMVGTQILSLPTHPTMTLKQAHDLIEQLDLLLHL